MNYELHRYKEAECEREEVLIGETTKQEAKSEILKNFNYLHLEANFFVHVFVSVLNL